MIRRRAAALIVRDKKLLMVSDGGDWHWTPGGRIEGDETYEQALIRELDEELGITPTTYKQYHLYQYHVDDAYFLTHDGEECCFLVEYDGDFKVGAEIKISKWMSKEDLRQIMPKSSVRDEVLSRLIEDDIL